MINDNKKKGLKEAFSVKKTGKYGAGVFANKDINKGDVIYILSGTKMSLQELVLKVISENERIDDPFQVGRKTYIDLNEISRTFNHSCDPCAGIRNESTLFALRNINIGEEITYDYSLTVAPTDWSMKCLCGAKNCRKIISDIRSIPKKQLERYARVGAVQRYMKKIIESLRAKTYKIPKYEAIALNKLAGK
jgi:SET domain-containing protein